MLTMKIVEPRYTAFITITVHTSGNLVLQINKSAIVYTYIKDAIELKCYAKHCMIPHMYMHVIKFELSGTISTMPLMPRGNSVMKCITL